MVVQPLIVEEVLDEPQEPYNVDVDGVFPHLALDRRFGCLAVLGPAARQGPERLVIRSMKQHRAVMDSHADDAVVESTISLIESNHGPLEQYQPDLDGLRRPAALDRGARPLARA